MAVKADEGRSEYDPTTEQMIETTPGWVMIAVDEFVDEGLLYEANRQWFWPKGMALTGTAWSPIAEMKAEMRSRVERALQATVLNVPNAGPISDHVVDAFLDIMLEDLAGKRRFGFNVTATDPPERIVSGRSKGDQAAIEVRAGKWISNRLRVLKP